MSPTRREFVQIVAGLAIGVALPRSVELCQFDAVRDAAAVRVTAVDVNAAYLRDVLRPTAQQIADRMLSEMTTGSVEFTTRRRGMVGQRITIEWNGKAMGEFIVTEEVPI